jgi:hypothetical protein
MTNIEKKIKNLKYLIQKDEYIIQKRTLIMNKRKEKLSSLSQQLGQGKLSVDNVDDEEELRRDTTPSQEVDKHRVESLSSSPFYYTTEIEMRKTFFRQQLDRKEIDSKQFMEKIDKLNTTKWLSKDDFDKRLSGLREDICYQKEDKIYPCPCNNCGHIDKWFQIK